jgi:uncharacterized protein YukE
LPGKAPAELLAGKFAREVFEVVIAGSEIDQGSIRQRSFAELEGRPASARGISNLAVYIGLLGTLVGLTLAVRVLREFPRIERLEDLKLFGDLTKDMFANFGVAFISAGTGIVATLVLAPLVAKYDKRAAGLAGNLESLCAEVIMPTAMVCRQRAKPTSSEDMLQKLLKIFGEVSEEAMTRMGAVAKTLNEATLNLSQSSANVAALGNNVLQATESVRNLNQQSEKTATALETAAGQVSAAATLSAASNERFGEFVSGWDPAPLREANEQMAKVVPNLETSLARAHKEQGEIVGDAVTRISGLLESTRQMIASQAALVATVDDVTRQLVPLAATQTQPSDPTVAHTSVQSSHEVLEVLRAIRAELAVRQAPMAISSSDTSSPTVIQPIPAEVVISLQAMSRTLGRIEQEMHALYMVTNGQAEERHARRLATRAVGLWTAIGHRLGIGQ